MTKQKIIEGMQPGDFYVDHTRHKYEGRLGWQWVARGRESGEIKEGVVGTHEQAIVFAEHYARR